VATSQTADSSLLAANAQPRTGTRRARRHVLRVGALVVVVLVATAIMVRFSSHRGASPLRYQTAGVDRGAIAAKVSASGALSALVTVSVGSQVSGRIESLRVDFGARVTRGQTVATIDPAMFRAALQQAAANLEAARAALERATAQRTNAERQYVRAKTLRAEHLVAQAELDTSEATLEVARADVRAALASTAQAQAARDQAQLNLRYTTIVSPIDGVVISRNVDVGQTVAATLQAPVLFTIAQDLTRMQVDANVAEADVGKIREGMPVSFSVDAYPGRAFSGKVRQVRDNAQTLQNVVTYDAVIDVDNAEHLLRPGMTATVSFVYAERSDVLRVPNAALRFKPDRATLAALGRESPDVPKGSEERVVWIVREGRAQPLRVRIGISDGATSEVLAGEVRAGERVVVEASVESKPAA
jgi:HlyD family secretion protein